MQLPPEFSLVGPKGYIHGWIKVGGSAITAEGDRGTVLSKPGNGMVRIRTRHGVEYRHESELHRHDVEGAALIPLRAGASLMEKTLGGRHASSHHTYGRGSAVRGRHVMAMSNSWPLPLPELNLVGPKGYVHGWKYVGPGQRSDKLHGDPIPVEAHSVIHEHFATSPGLAQSKGAYAFKQAGKWGVASSATGKPSSTVAGHEHYLIDNSGKVTHVPGSPMPGFQGGKAKFGPDPGSSESRVAALQSRAQRSGSITKDQFVAAVKLINADTHTTRDQKISQVAMLRKLVKK